MASLPPMLSGTLALQDVTTTKEQLSSCIGKTTTPTETPIFICSLGDCARLYPTRERLMVHRKRDHGTEETGDVITWNE